MDIESHPVILFDGMCNLCTWSVQFIITRDPAGYFRFASLQSPVGQRLAVGCDVDVDAAESVVLIDRDGCHTQSDAAIRIARHLAGWWPLLSVGRFLPTGVRDRLYRLVAENRYRWFGQRDQCMLPTPELQQRFLRAGPEQTTG